MTLLFSNHTQIANKWLILLSGINKNAVNEKGEKVYENQYFNLPSEWTKINWSKSMIKQTLAYLGLSNSNGDLGIIDLEELSKLLNCSVRSLRNNHKKYIELGLIKVKELSCDLVHVELVDYLQNFIDLDKETNKSKTGFTTIHKSALFDLFNINNVNVLRIACRAFYLQERDVKLGKHKSILLSSNDLKGFLPKYFTYRPVIERKLRSIMQLFEFKFFADKENKKFLLNEYQNKSTFADTIKAPYIVSMKLHTVKDSVTIKRNEVHNFNMYRRTVNEMIKLTGMESVAFETFQELVHEYGYEPITYAIDDIMAIHTRNLDHLTEAAVDSVHEIHKLNLLDEPIGILRKIFKKYAIHSQGGYLFQI